MTNVSELIVHTGKYDPPSTSATIRDKEALKELDLSLRDPPPLPEWLSTHNRKASRIDVDVSRFSSSPSWV